MNDATKAERRDVYAIGKKNPNLPFHPAVRAGDFIFVSGQVPVDPATGELVSADIARETRQVLDNIKGILTGCGATMADVVRCGVFLGDGKDFAAMNAVYAEYFGDAKPARATVVTGFALPGVRVEIDAIVYKPR
jgi:2-iminobutanoate/2-iminopropanoate deaminase